MGVAEIRRLKQLEEENAKLKHEVAEHVQQVRACAECMQATD